MRDDDFDLIADILKKRSGLTLTREKVYLLETRLLPVARQFGFDTLELLIQAIRKQPNEAMLVEITEAMTTNESSFFRDIKPFEQFRRTVLPRLIEDAKDKRSVRIWSSACSTGQEPYSLAMSLMEEAGKMIGWDYEIIATDISRKVLEKAEKGEYTQFEVQRGLPIQMLVKYFTQSGESWRLNSSVRARVRFQYLNLLEDFNNLGRFDIIFCRNVLIYFDAPTKTKVLERLTRSLQPKGFLFLGSAETILGLTDKLKPVDGERGIFQPA
ncbi:MAG: protein-glutamate O-methyltransferase CheR [Alphaproteobacteria bacterium]|nr:protein-glutamate O-methyltransferase CheR [Alphaproteobacteria bacterium]